MYLVNNTLAGLPALPVEKSSVVVIAEITSGTAYLSEDHSSSILNLDYCRLIN